MSRPTPSAEAPVIGPPESLAPVWLVLGDASLLVRQAVDEIAEKALLGGIAAFNRAEGSAEEGVGALLSLARTQPMLGGRRVILIRDMDKAKVADLDALLAYAENPCPSAVVVMHGPGTPAPVEGTDRGRRLQNLVQKTGRLIRFKADEQNPVDFAVTRARAGGCTLDRRDAEALVEVVGRDLGTLAAEVDKLCTFLGGEGAIREAAIREVCSALAEAVVWDLTDAIARRDANRALAILHRMLEEGEAPQKILALVGWKIRQMLSVQECDRKGIDPYKAGIRMPPQQLGAIRSALKVRPLQPGRVLETLAQAHQDMHGHRAGDRRVLEGLVLRLVAR